MVRKPIVAGSFYPSDFQELNESILWSFSAQQGPGSLPLKDRKKSTVGIVAPHAGYPFSGPCAAWAYKEIAESRFPDVYILLGLSHAGHPTCLSLEDWETPLGVVRTNKEIGKALVKKGIMNNEEAHRNEHSIEVQLPFLQFSAKDNLNKLSIMPIIASSDVPPPTIAKTIADTTRDLELNPCIIASSDFTHFGLTYGYFPFQQDIKKNMYELDKKAIGHIANLDYQGFLEYVMRTGATICGKYPIAVAIELSRLLGAKKAKLLHYYTSGDITKDYGSAVGYGSITIH